MIFPNKFQPCHL